MPNPELAEFLLQQKAERTPPITLFVGYVLKAKDAETVERLMPAYEPSEILKGQAQAEELKSRQETFRTCAPLSAYTATFADIYMIDPSVEKPLQWLALPDKQAPAIRFCTWLKKAHPQLWAKDADPERRRLRIFGFDPHLFLLVLGVECSLPPISKPLSPRIWLGAERVDIADIVLPPRFDQHLQLRETVLARQPTEEKHLAAWLKIVKDWSGPGTSAEKDAKLTCELAGQLGLLPKLE